MVITEPQSSARAKKRVLFVCNQNRVRSLTAEWVYRRRPDLEVQSAGIAEHSPVPLTEELLNWAEEVFVFSKEQRKIIERRFPGCFNGKRVVNLQLPDVFHYKSPELVTELSRKAYPYLGASAKDGGIAPRRSPTPSVERNPAPDQRQLRLRVVAAWSVALSLASWFSDSLSEVFK